MKGFPDRVRAARVAAGMTQEQLGFAVGVTKSSVSAWENGRETPGFRTLPRLPAVLKRSLDELVCGITELGVTEINKGHAVGEFAVAARDEKERALLLRYRAMSARGRHALLELIRALEDERAETK